MDQNGYEDGEERHHTPSLRATPLKRGSVGSRGGLGLVGRKGDEWTDAALVRLAVTVGEAVRQMGSLRRLKKKWWRCFAWPPRSTLRVGIDEERCQQVRGLFVKDQDEAFPLTDCTSFAVMREMGLKDAPTADPHFITMGFNPLLID